MLRWLILIVLLLPGVAQAAETVLHSAATANADGKNIAVSDKGSLGLTVTISGTATVTFQGSADGGTTWSDMNCIALGTTTEVTSATSSGQYQCSVGGLTHARAPISGCSGCTVTVQASSSLASRGRSGGSGAGTLDQAFDGGKVIDGANSLANAVRIGDGVTPMCIYTDATAGPIVTPCTDSNVRTRIPANFTWCLFDVEGGNCALTVDPDAASANAMYQFGANYRPRKSIWFPAGSLSTDGTECSAPAELTINSGPKAYGIVCSLPGTNLDGHIYGSVVMPDSWDGGTVTFKVSAVLDTDGASSVTLHGVVAAQAVATTGTIASTYGTQQDLDLAEAVADAQWDMIQTTSAAVTASGSPAGGQILVFRYTVCDTGTPPTTGCSASSATAVADFTILGLTLEYSTSSLSD
jgi:hypothetical protein